MNKIFYLLILLICVGCTKIHPTYEVTRCIDKPSPKVLECQPECGIYTADNRTAKYECIVCAEDLKNLLTYIKSLDRYGSDECLTIKRSN